MSRLTNIVLASATFLALPFVVLATDQTSNNFQNKDSTFSPATFKATSPNFQLNSTLDPLTGITDSPSFIDQSGAASLNDPTVTPPPPPPPPPPPGGGSSGNGGKGGQGSNNLGSPTLNFPAFTFQSHVQISGDLPAGANELLVNNSSAGVTYPTPTTWQFDLPLFLGKHPFSIQARSANGQSSSQVAGEIERGLIGDINQDGHVNDLDLSLFTRAWKTYNLFADFNDDKKIDYSDLSLLVSHWDERYTVQSGEASPASSGTPTPSSPAVQGSVPTMSYHGFSYQSHTFLTGDLPAGFNELLVNGSSAGVSYPTPTTWQRDFPLFVGKNTVYIQARSASGHLSPRVYGEINRGLIGDVNHDGHVNDIDLSLFTRAWKTYTLFADFNEDNKIDYLDLSLLVSHWQ